VRERNRAAIKRFMSHWDADVDEVFTDDAVKELTYWTFQNPDGEPVRYRGKEQIRQNYAVNRERTVSFDWLSVQISATEDPNVFWVEASGAGAMRFDGVVRPYAQSNYVVRLQMREGRIAFIKIIGNPLEMIKAVGGRIELPTKA
jgi:hypothetical protein